MSTFLRLLVAAVLGGVILFLGIWFLRAFSSGGGRSVEAEPQDVSDLEVYFVCGECGTEYQVTKVGELSIPRHCGETMQVERRPKGLPGG